MILNAYKFIELIKLPTAANNFLKLTFNKMQGTQIKIKDLLTSDKNASSDSPPNAFFSAASSYGIPIQGLQFKTIKYHITLQYFNSNFSHDS